MSELPPPDLLDSGGRLRRLVIALAVAAGLAVIVYTVTWALATPDEQANGVAMRGAYRFVWYFTGFAFFGTFPLVLAVLTRREKKKWMEAQVAQARVVKR